jgi:CheY-like chemotaxis protein
MAVWRLLAVDDDKDICNQIKEFLEGEKGNEGEDIEVEIINEFSKALEILEKQKFDLVILDLRVGLLSDDQPEEEAGIKTLKAIKQRLFIPIIFHTGISHLVEDLKSNLVDVITKSEDLDQLLDAIRKMFKTQLPHINKALTNHVEEVQRQYMWDFVEKHWSDFSRSDNEGELAYLLARRLALSLSVNNIRELKTELGGLVGKVLTEGNNQNESLSHAHPVAYYICPVISKNHRTGDIYKYEGKSFYVLLTPSCDLIVRNNNRCKADEVLLAKCAPLTQQQEYIDWNKSSDNQKKIQDLKSLMTNGKGAGRQDDRFHFLPGVQLLNIPDLIIDLQSLCNTSYVDFTESGKWERIASLDRPYAEALSTKLTRYFGRIGTPDLNTDVIFERLRLTRLSNIDEVDIQ